MAENAAEPLTDTVRVDQGQLRGHIDAVVCSSVEEALNALLQAETDQICGAGRCERSPDRLDTRAGHHERKLETKADEVRLKVPNLRSSPFETAIIGLRGGESSAPCCHSGVPEILLASTQARLTVVWLRD